MPFKVRALFWALQRPKLIRFILDRKGGAIRTPYGTLLDRGGIYFQIGDSLPDGDNIRKKLREKGYGKTIKDLYKITEVRHSNTNISGSAGG